MKVSVSGIRGRYGKDLTLYEIWRYATLFGSGLFDQGLRKCVIGRDTRPSSMIISRVVESALMTQGIDVYNIGISPTPFVFREARKYHAGCMITASHNPLDWNGLKFVYDGRGLYENELSTMLERSVQQQSTFGCAVRSSSGYIGELLELASGIHIAKDTKVGLDPGGGAACHYSYILFRNLGYIVASINDIFGIHPRIPDPTVDELNELRTLVRSNSLDLGLALDLDGDRLVVIDKAGKKLTSDLTLLLCIATAMKLGIRKYVLSIDTSSTIKEFILSHNGLVYHSKVGEANVVKEMSETGAEAGGEGSSAGFIMSKFNMCRDGLLAGLLISSMDRETMNDCVRLSSKYLQIRSKLAADSSLHKQLIERLYEVLVPISCESSKIDGIRLVIDENSWVLIRPSNTEHVIRISVESLADKASALYRDILTKTKLVYDEIK